MGKHCLITCCLALFLFSCERESETWDPRLNGRWTEVTPVNAKALPSGCDLLFNDNYFEICGQPLTKDVNTKSSLYSSDGQIYIQYNLGLKRHVEFRYDFTFEGEFLWIMEETTDKSIAAPQISGAKKFRKL